MTAKLFVGCLFVAFGIPTLLFFMLVARKAVLLIVSISSAFFWLCSLLFSSLLWLLLRPLGGEVAMVPIAVLIQEALRYMFFKFYARAERSFAVVSTNAIAFPMTDLYSSIAAGVGFALVQCVLVYGSILGSALGPGALFSDYCPQMSTFVLSAWMSFCFGIMHIFWMILAFDAYRESSRAKLIVVIGSHLAAALMTMVNGISDGCVIVLPTLFALTVVLGIWTGYVIHQPTYRSKRRI